MANSSCTPEKARGSCDVVSCSDDQVEKERSLSAEQHLNNIKNHLCERMRGVGEHGRGVRGCRIKAILGAQPCSTFHFFSGRPRSVPLPGAHCLRQPPKLCRWVGVLARLDPSPQLVVRMGSHRGLAIASLSSDGGDGHRRCASHYRFKSCARSSQRWTS